MRLFFNRRYVLVPSLVVAAVVAFVGCSSDGGSGPNVNSSEESSSSVSSSSRSSSSVPSSSSQSGGNVEPESEWCKTVGNCGTLTDSRDRTIYRWTKIGDQIWMAENLNFGTRVAGAEDQKNATASSAEKFCYNNDETNCDTYGGLYQWHSAMALPFSCNSHECADQITSPHRGICPEGWHVPTRDEWVTLQEWVDLDNDGEENRNEGLSLKSLSGWNDDGNGTDAYGWTGLPGGDCDGGSFSSQGSTGHWWLASEYNEEFAYRRNLYGSLDDFSEGGSTKDYGFSLRCVKDER